MFKALLSSDDSTTLCVLIPLCLFLIFCFELLSMFFCSLILLFSESLELDQREGFSGYIPSLVLSEFVLRKCLELSLFISLFVSLLFAHAFSPFGSLKAHLCYFSSFPALFQAPNSPQHRHICLHPSRINSALSEKIFTCKIQDNFTHKQYWVVSLLQRIIQHHFSPGHVP